MSERGTTDSDPPLPIVACDLTDPERARRLRRLRQNLFSRADAVDHLDNGFAYRFPGDNAESTLHALAEFVAAERECCSFIRFAIVVEPREDAIILRLRGGPGVKEFVAEAFGAASP